jgi:hypothetical protein
MKQITLPVAGLTRAVMLHKYGREPIRLDNNDLRRREMMHVGTSNLHLERKQYSLNSTITLNVNRHEYEHMVNREAEIGFYLYAQDKADMFIFVWARVTAGLPALNALKDYYSTHNIEEDNHSLETAERQWKRFRVEKEKERITNTPQYVPSLLCVLLSERQAEAIVNRMLAMIDADCIQMDPRYRSAVESWVYTDLTPMTFRQVAKKLDRAVGNVGNSVIRLRAYMKYNQELRTLVAYCLKTTQAKPTPSAAS